MIDTTDFDAFVASASNIKSLALKRGFLVNIPLQNVSGCALVGVCCKGAMLLALFSGFRGTLRKSNHPEK
ncbi:hypothetical protein KCP69_17400 [Salmonella enterica subsp. enterica]|nr:hypothetical protein KCP69_17400 [Salmonella enterica subsp. enterica]